MKFSSSIKPMDGGMLFKVICFISIGSVACRSALTINANHEIGEESTAPKWNKTFITYRISKYPSKLGEKETDEEIKRAFDEWSKVIPLTFTQIVDGKADIEIKFSTGNHGCNSPFDGRGKTLAHAFQFGDIHFDDDEDWTINSETGINLYSVTLHSIGHTLSLPHETESDSVMYPFYTYQVDFKLSTKDVERIQKIYGPK